VLAGTSLASAELNHVQLFTTLQPGGQCPGAIRLSSVRSLPVRTADPPFRGVERIADVNSLIASDWPTIVELEVSEWTACALLLPTHVGEFWGASVPAWGTALPSRRRHRRVPAAGEPSPAVSGRDRDPATPALSRRRPFTDMSSIAALAVSPSPKIARGRATATAMVGSGAPRSRRRWLTQYHMSGIEALLASM
jgi:hypothetical protein